MNEIAAISADNATLPRRGIVYAIQRGISIAPSAVKFGFTTGNVFDRLKALQTGSADILYPCTWAFGTEQDERAIHAHFDDFHMSGEWFFPAKKVLAAARNMEGFLPTIMRGWSPFADMRNGYEQSGEFRHTESLLRAEMQRVINIREKSISDDIKSLAGLRAGFVAAEPYWEKHPNWTFGQCCAAMMKSEAA